MLQLVHHSELEERIASGELRIVPEEEAGDLLSLGEPIVWSSRKMPSGEDIQVFTAKIGED